MLLTNGRIHTMDAAGSVVDSLVIRAGRVAFAGRRGDINPAPREPRSTWAAVRCCRGWWMATGT
jgi:predicted amidohydrolase YtcJ